MIGNSLEELDAIHKGIIEQWCQPPKDENNTGGQRDEPPKDEEEGISQKLKLAVSKEGTSHKSPLTIILLFAVHHISAIM